MLELAKAQLALLGGGLVNFAATVAVVDLQLDTLGRELQRHIVKGHHEGEAAGAVGRYLQILGGAVFHIGDKQLDVIAGQAHIVVVLLCDIIQGALLDGMDDHRCAAANLGVAVVIGAGGAADLIAVFRRGFGAAGGSCDGLQDAVQDRQEFRVDPVLGRIRFGQLNLIVFGCFFRCRAACVIVDGELVTLPLFAFGIARCPIGIPYLIDIVAVTGCEGKLDLIRGFVKCFIGGTAVGHGGIGNGFAAVHLLLLGGLLILDGGRAVIDMDGGGGLGIPVNGRGIRQRLGLGGGIRFHIDAALRRYKALSELRARFVQQRLAQGDVRLVVVFHEGNRHGTNQLALVLVGGAGGAHEGFLGAGGAAGRLAEGGHYVHIAFAHGEDVPAIGVRRELFFGADHQAVYGIAFLQGQLFQLIAVCRIDPHQNLLILLCVAGIKRDAAGAGAAQGLRGNLIDTRAHAGGILGRIEGLRGAAVCRLHGTGDTGVAVNGAGSQSQGLFVLFQLSEYNRQRYGVIRHNEGEVRSIGPSLAGCGNHGQVLNPVGFGIRIADGGGVNGIAAVGNGTDRNGVAGVGFYGGGNGAVLRRLNGDGQLAAADLLDSIVHQAAQLCLANGGQGIPFTGQQLQDAGHNAGDGVQVHGLALAVRVVHGRLGHGPCLLNGLAEDVDVAAGGKLSPFGHPGLAVLEHHCHGEEAAEADGPFAGSRGCGGGAALAGGDVRLQQLRGRILLGNGGNGGGALRENVDVSAGVDHAVHGGHRVQGYHAQRQGQGNDADGGYGGGGDLGLAGQPGKAAGGDGAGGGQSRAGIGRGHNHGQGNPDPLVELIVGLYDDFGVAVRFHLSACLQAAVNADFGQTHLDDDGEGGFLKARVQVEDGLGLTAGGGQGDVLQRRQPCVFGDLDLRAGFQIEIQEVEIQAGVHIAQLQGTGLGQGVLVIVPGLNDDVVGGQGAVHPDLLAVDFQIQTGHVNAADFQLIPAEYQFGEVKPLAFRCPHGEGAGFHGTENAVVLDHIVGEGVGYVDGAVNDVAAGDLLLGLVGDAVCQSMDAVGIDGDGLAGLACRVDNKVVVHNLLAQHNRFFVHRIGAVGVDLAAEGQHVVALAAFNLQLGNGIGGIHIHTDAVGARTQIDAELRFLTAGFFPGDRHGIVAVAAVHGHRRFFASGEGQGHGIVPVAGMDGGIAFPALGIGNGIGFLGAVNGDAGLVLGFHKAVDGEVETRHDQLKILGRVDRNVAGHIGSALALGAYGGLVNDAALFRGLVGILRQDVELEAVGQIFAGGVHGDVAVVLAFADHDGNILAVCCGSCQGFLDGLVDGIVGGGFSGSDVCIVGGILGGVVVVFLQSAELDPFQLLLYLFGRNHRLVGALDDNVGGNGLRAGLGLIQLADDGSARSLGAGARSLGAGARGLGARA